MGTFETILFEKQRRGVLLTLNRPALRNALNQQMKDELRAALELARDDEEIRAVVITGAGAAFSSGDDMNESMQELGPDRLSGPMVFPRAARWWTSTIDCASARGRKRSTSNSIAGSIPSRSSRR